MTGQYGDCTIVKENGDGVEADEDGNEYEMEAQ